MTNNTTVQKRTVKNLNRKTANTNAVNANRSKFFRIPADQIAAGCEGLPEEQAAAIKWLGQYCRNNDLGKDQISTLIKQPNGKYYGYDSVYQLLTGGRARRKENIQPICEAIDTLRELEIQREKLVSSGFIHTGLASEIWKRCDRARLRQRIGYIFGDSQIGKTEALKEYQRRNNHGQTLYFECPDGGSKGALLKLIAKQIGISAEISLEELSDRIIATVDHTMLIIFDEAHRMLKNKAGLRALDFIRRLWNQTKCGIILAMTNEGKKALLTGPNAKELQQLWRRRTQPLQLPAVPFESDLELFAAAYHLPPATDEEIAISINVITNSGRTTKKTHRQSPLALQQQVVTEEGLGVWIMILQDASDIASDLGRDITWGAVIKAHCLAQAESELIQ